MSGNNDLIHKLSVFRDKNDLTTQMLNKPYHSLPFSRTTTTFLSRFEGSALAERASIETAADFDPTKVPLNSNWASLKY